MIANRNARALVSAVLAAAAAYGGSVDNRNNNSADYIRTLSRHAATEGADLAIYNPAGAVRLPDGLHLNVNNQSIAKYNEQRLRSPAVTYEQNLLSPLYPTGYAVFKKDGWAAFGAFSFPGGGGELQYEKGSATVFLLQSNLSAMTPRRNADAYLRSVYYGGTVGGAYALNDQWSVSLSVRHVYARTDVTVDADTVLQPLGTSKVIDHMEEARGWGGVLSVDYFPMPGLVLALRYESHIPLEFEVARSSLNLDQVIKDAGARAAFTTALRANLRAPGSTFQRDLPAVVGLGAGYAWNPSLRTDLSLSYYGNSWADWGGKENLHEDGWETSLGAEFRLRPSLLLSAGAMYTLSGADAGSYQQENPALDSYTLAFGGKYSMSDRFSLSAGWAGNFTLSDEIRVTTVPVPTTAELTKSVIVYALGIEYRAF